MKWFLLLMATAAMAWAQDRRVADYYLNNQEPYLGKKITLNCAYVNRETEQPGGDFVVFRAYTFSKGTEWNSAMISVRVPSDKSSAFAKKYGSDYTYSNYEMRGRPMSGIFAQDGGGYYLAYTPSS